MTEASEWRWMPLREFIDAGYLQEVNRRVLHPVGLALAIRQDEQGALRVAVRDARDDPEGFMFDDLDEDNRTKRVFVEQERAKRATARIALMGDIEQPIIWVEREG